MNKEKKKIFGREIGWRSLRFFIFLNGNLPLGWSYFLGNILGTAAYFIAARHRRSALDSLAVAFPELSVKKRKRIACDSFVFMAQSALEALCFLKEKRYLENIHIEGLNNLEQALKKRQGVIIVSAHLGNFPLMSLKSAKEGYPINVVVRPMRDSKAGDYFQKVRTTARVKTIFSYPRKECVKGIINALRNNEVVIIQMDQNFGTGGVWVNFFGKLAATPVGPIVFALRTNAAIIPGYTVRESKGRHIIKLLPQEELVCDENRDKTILLNTVKITRIIEQWVRNFPAQWGWIHRRWKSRPSEDIRSFKFKMETDLYESFSNGG